MWIDKKEYERRLRDKQENDKICDYLRAHWVELRKEKNFSITEYTNAENDGVVELIASMPVARWCELENEPWYEEMMMFLQKMEEKETPKTPDKE